MTIKQWTSKNDKSSIRYWWIPIDGQSFESDNVLPNRDAYLKTDCRAKSSKQQENISSSITTSKFVSAISGAWDFVGQSEGAQTKSSLQYSEIGHPDGQKFGSTPLVCGEKISNEFTCENHSPSAKSNFEDLKTLKRMICFASCSRNINNLAILRDSHLNVECFRLDNAAVSRSIAETENFSLTQNVNIVETTSDTCQSQLITGISENNVRVVNSADSVLGRGQDSTNSSCVAVESSSEVSTSKDHIIHENCTSIIHDFGVDEDYSTNYQLSIQNKLQPAFAKNKHALAGGLAGTIVSICLHPVDTVKTVIQANGANQKSTSEILRTIISERGSLGLYRGIASSIASSAPISAIYTCTYESVKGTLQPLLPKEYHSLAHCIAGGCSSIATSFVFTPSERIKQQMQVATQYQNSWNALIGCLEKGGVYSLYTGWGAVLCRNIPHSVIKFYTYERLKQFFLKSSKPNTSLSTIQMLACGGIAGSTAALFTTPFDVVKTRLQTQVPGSLAKYNGVLDTLHEIAKEEGLQGLYRGLAPRLAMYVSQGAIFFASYEILKAVFSLETSPKLPKII